MKLFAALAIPAAMIAVISSTCGAFADEPDSGNTLVAACNNPVSGKFDNPGILIYNEGTRAKPSLVAVEIWQNESGPTKGWTENARVENLKLSVAPGEEIHFSQTGFELEILTEADHWSAFGRDDRYSPTKTDTQGHLTATVLGHKVSLPMACSIYY